MVQGIIFMIVMELIKYTEEDEEADKEERRRRRRRRRLILKKKMKKVMIVDETQEGIKNLNFILVSVIGLTINFIRCFNNV